MAESRLSPCREAVFHVLCARDDIDKNEKVLLHELLWGTRSFTPETARVYAKEYPALKDALLSPDEKLVELFGCKEE